MNRKDGESQFEYKVRMLLAKLNKEISLEWDEIVELLGEDCSGDHMRKTAYGIREYHNYLHNKNGIATRILSISDTHVPYQLPVEAFREYVGCIDILQLNGDILDCQSISKFPKTYRVSMIEEMIQARQYIIDLIECLKPKKVVINYGNHELRFQAYLAKNLDEDMLQLMPQTALDLICTDGFNHYDKRNKCKTWYEPLVKVFDDVEVVYTEDWKCKIGKAWFVHPSAYSSGMLKTAEKAMDYLFRTDREKFDCVIMSHTHKLGSYIQGEIHLFEQGAACKVEEHLYGDGKLFLPQQKGCIFLCQDNDGNLIYEKTKLDTLN